MHRPATTGIGHRASPASMPAFAAPAVGEGRVRAVVDAVLPIVDGGRFAAKRIAGRPVDVTAHAFTDGHDLVRVRLCWRAESETQEHEGEMRPLGNDVWHASFVPPRPARYFYTAVAWVDHFQSWCAELARRDDLADLRLAARSGALLVEAAAERATAEDRETLVRWAKVLRMHANDAAVDVASIKACALDMMMLEVAGRHPDRSLQARYEPTLPLIVDRERAGFSSWYEMFPRSAAFEQGRHGTFKDVERWLPRIAALGFDVLYLPPIHPIGRDKRKGKNNALEAEPADVGSPWAIGASEGGHTAILPALGSAQDFRDLVVRAASMGIEVALDIAFQCAPDHPWVKEHPQWFRWRPDNTVQYAENPPKKYQDIYPFNFETDDWHGLWQALKGVFDHWIAQGVEIFRVDNPHTKAFAFWEWAIGEIKRDHPRVLFLAEAFTRPKVMHRLAKLGFSQSYTYFTWRNTRAELTEYFVELTEGPGREYFRPNVWPNTPDILHESLHGAPLATYMVRVLLAATLCANYGIYGPAYELMENTPREPGSEEYLDSEKYQIRHWDLGRVGRLSEFIARVNRARLANEALQADSRLRFFHCDNDSLIAYGRRSAAGSSAVVLVVNLDPRHRQSGWVHIDAEWLGARTEDAFTVQDLLTDRAYSWSGGGNFVILDPEEMPAHLLRVSVAPSDNTVRR